MTTSYFGAVVVSATMKEVSKDASPIPVEVYTPKFFQKNATPSIFEALTIVNGIRPQLNCNVCNTGDIQINGLKLCGRCVMINIDQENGIMTGSEPLRTLSKYRKEGSKVMFGRYFESGGDFEFSVGMAVAASL